MYLEESMEIPVEGKYMENARLEEKILVER